MEVLTVYLVPVILLLASLLALKENGNSYALQLEGGQRRSIQKTWTERLLRIIAPFERCPPVVAAGQRPCCPQ